MGIEEEKGRKLRWWEPSGDAGTAGKLLRRCWRVTSDGSACFFCFLALLVDDDDDDGGGGGCGGLMSGLWANQSSIRQRGLFWRLRVLKYLDIGLGFVLR